MEGHKTFRDLLAWQKAHAFVVLVYQSTELFPKHERYGLVSQWRRAAVSIPANIVEGYAKSTIADQLRFLDIAKGSLAECEYFIVLSEDLRYLTPSQAQDLERERKQAARLLMGLMRSLRQKA